MKAVVIKDLNDLSVESVDLDSPKTGEVLVKMKASGVCHSDLSVLNGTLTQKLPMVIGHEGAGIVEALGENVSGVSVGDHVAMSFVPNCGECFYCGRDEAYLCVENKPHGGLLDGTSRVSQNGDPISVFSFLGNMAEYCVVPASCVVPIDKSYSFEAAALVSCGVATGVGAVLKTADVQPGSTVAVFGCGGVGLNIIQGAKIAGAKQIIAVDTSDEKMQLAESFGATHRVSTGKDAAKQTRELTNGFGVDYAFDAVGNSKVAEACFKATRNNGVIIVVGMGKLDDQIRLSSLLLPFFSKTIKGSMYGSTHAKVDLPKYMEYYRKGQLCPPFCSPMLQWGPRGVVTQGKGAIGPKTKLLYFTDLNAKTGRLR
ncbi:MAG: Zn-dependent alcohol dehydrogenase, partial [Pseudomonadota bacterium]